MELLFQLFYLFFAFGEEKHTSLRLHHRAIVIGHIEIFIVFGANRHEIISQIRVDYREIGLNILVSVNSTLFVIKANSMAKNVCNDTNLNKALDQM